MITLTPAEASALRDAEATLRHLDRSGWPARRPDIITARDGLAGSVETFRAIAAGTLLPLDAFGDDGEIRDSPDATSLALARALREAAEWMAELGRLTAESSDEERRAA